MTLQEQNFETELVIRIKTFGIPEVHRRKIIATAFHALHMALGSRIEMTYKSQRVLYDPEQWIKGAERAVQFIHEPQVEARVEGNSKGHDSGGAT